MTLADGSKTCSCDAGCRSFGACLRRKGLRYAVGAAHQTNHEWDEHLDRYEYARRQGIQPESTIREATERAIAISELTGEPYQAAGI